MKKVYFLLCILFIPVFCNAKTRFFYDIFEEEAQQGEYVKEFTREHRDSFLEEPSKKVYYWNAYLDNEKANAILDKNNIIFGGYCWQMLRTTDTGGVKLIYNGVPQEGKCPNTGTRQIGTSYYNNQDTSIADVGYMYNIRYVKELKKTSIQLLYSGTISTNYYYADSITTSENYYNLQNPYKISSTDEYANLVGKYTFTSSSESYSGMHVYYIAGVKDNKYYYMVLENGKTLSEVDKTIVFGSSFDQDNDGVFHINNSNTIQKSEYFIHKGDLKNSYICNNSADNTCTDLWFVYQTSDQGFNYIRVSENFKYSSGFTYDENTGIYTLSDDSDNVWNYIEQKSWMRNHHYTCLNESGECESLKYVYYMETGNIYYINLKNGKGLEEALDEMLYGDDVNHNNSIIKTTIDNWYANHLTEYTSYLEDVLFCYSRNILSSFRASGWQADGWLDEKPNIREIVNLSCEYETDSFSMSNPKAKLTYPVGLPNDVEMDLLGNDLLRKTGSEYWVASKSGFLDFSYVTGVNQSGYYGSNYYAVDMRLGVRPVISLKPKSRYVSGDGSRNNPYIYDYNDYYNIDVVIKNETKELDIEIEDITSVPEGEQVTFTVTPIKGYRINGIQIVDQSNQEIEYQETDNQNEYTFIMPGEDVTIIPSYEKKASSVTVEENSHTKEIVIEVNDATAVVYEDVVRFTIEAEEGYELVEIEITDAEGNEVEYHKTNNDNEYEFTMPDSNVIIKPIYREIPKQEEPTPIINPNTGRSLLWIGIMLVLGFSTRIIYKAKKMNT